LLYRFWLLARCADARATRHDRCAGLTKIATDNQPASIVRELEEMSRAYIRPKNVIILAVSPANADIATSDAMRLVREFDPQGACVLERALCN
jgi:replication fork clamp-binding protein CrfC